MRHILKAGAAAILLNSAVNAAGTTIAVPDITITRGDGALAIVGTVEGLADGEVNATLTIAKSDNGGNVQSSQSRIITVTEGSSDVVAKTSLSVGPGVILNITLTLMDGDIQIATATTTLGTKSD